MKTILTQNLLRALNSALDKHAEKNHEIKENVLFKGDMIDPPDIEHVVTGTRFPFKEWAFHHSEVDEAFNALCDHLENERFDIKHLNQ